MRPQLLTQVEIPAIPICEICGYNIIVSEIGKSGVVYVYCPSCKAKLEKLEQENDHFREELSKHENL